jgi:hypothetical protein
VIQCRLEFLKAVIVGRYVSDACVCLLGFMRKPA